MKRRRIVSGLLLVLLALSVLAGAGHRDEAASAEKVYKWKLVEFYGPTEFPTNSWKGNLIPEIKKVTGGRLEITQYVMGEHPYSIFDALKAAREMAPELMQMPYAQCSGEDKRLAVFDLPMLFPPKVEPFYRIYDRFSEPFFKPILAKYGYQPFLRMTWQPQRIGGRDFFVAGWDSLKGKRIRVWNPQLGALVKLLGGTPVSISWGEISTSLQTGLIEGVITNSSSMYISKFYEYLKYLTAMEIQFGAHDYIINKNALAALPDDLQKAILHWAKEKEPWVRKELSRFHDENTEKGIKEYGISVKVPASDFREGVRTKCWDAVWKPWIEAAGGLKGPTGEAFNAVAKALIEDGVGVPGYTPY